MEKKNYYLDKMNKVSLNRTIDAGCIPNKYILKNGMELKLIRYDDLNKTLLLKNNYFIGEWNIFG